MEGSNGRQQGKAAGKGSRERQQGKAAGKGNSERQQYSGKTGGGGGGADLQADREDCGEAGPEAVPQPGCGLPPEHQGGKGAEHEAGAIQPADGREAVQNSLHAKQRDRILHRTYAAHVDSRQAVAQAARSAK